MAVATNGPAGSGAGPAGERAPPTRRPYRLVWMLILLAASAWYLWQAVPLPPLGRNVTPPPHFFPILVGGLLVLSTVVLSLKELARWRESEASTAPQPDARGEADEPVSFAGKRDFVVSLAILCVFFLLIRPLGFYLSAGAMLLGLSCYFEPRKWLRNLLASTFIVAMAYAIFHVGLGIGLPTGTLW